MGESSILKWTNLADLMRVSGIGRQFSELLEAAEASLFIAEQRGRDTIGPD